MIQRLAVVIWWVGAGAIVIGLLFAGVRLAVDRTCAPIFAENASLRAKARQASDEAVEFAKRAATEERRTLSEFGEALARRQAYDGVMTEKRAGLEQDVALCEADSKGNEWIIAGRAGVLGLIALAIAFVLGGSFLRPPRRSVARVE